MQNTWRGLLFSGQGKERRKEAFALVSYPTEHRSISNEGQAHLLGLFGVIKSKNFAHPHFVGGVPLPKNNTSVVVTGLGALTPVGNDVPTTWRALVEGRSGIKRITRFDPIQLRLFSFS